MNWKHGYYADSGYTYGYYAETSPARLAWAALIQGHQTPTTRFRYLDAGCGQGLSLLLMAAAHPESEFVGVDFLPEHIAHATELAEDCGLTNIRFLEGDFIELERNPQSLGQFDYAVCHGITTWIAPAVKQALFGLIGKVLRPGGLFYNSYNTFPGWLSAVPFQHLVLLEQRSKTGALALKSARESMDKLTEAGKGFFTALPGLPTRLKGMDAQDPAYLVQEYNNQFWHPVFVTQMMDEMAAVKLGYLGTATLPEAYDSSYIPALRELLAAQATPELREQLRDFGVNQGFRRDLYVKGRSRPWAAELQSQIRGFRVVVNPTVARPEKGAAFSIKAGGIELSGDAAHYSALLDRIGASTSGLSVGEVIDGSANPSQWTAVAQSLSMLVHTGHLMLHQTSFSREIGHRVNRALANAVCAGAPYRYLSLPAATGASVLGETEWYVLAAAANGQPQEQWSTHAASVLANLGRSLAKDGKPVSDPKEQKRLLDETVARFLPKLAFYRAMGAV